MRQSGKLLRFTHPGGLNRTPSSVTIFMHCSGLSLQRHHSGRISNEHGRLCAWQNVPAERSRETEGKKTTKDRANNAPEEVVKHASALVHDGDKATPARIILRVSLMMFQSTSREPVSSFIIQSTTR